MLYSIALTYLAILAILFGIGPFRTPDLWWHLAAGEWMTRTGIVPPVVDPFTLTAAGMPWTDHSWLSQLLFAGTWRFAGLEGVGALKIVLIYGASAGLWGIVRRRHPRAPMWLPLLCATIYFPAQWFHLTARPLLISHLLFILFVYFTRAWRAPLVCALLMIPWANCHAAAFGGLLYLGLWAMGDALDRKSNWIEHNGSWFRWMAWAAVAATAAATMANPYGFDLARYPFQLMGRSLGLMTPQEWLPPGAFPLMWPFWFLLGASVLTLVHRRTRPRASALLPMAAFGIMAIVARRHVEFFNILALANLGDALAGLPGIEPAEDDAGSNGAAAPPRIWTRRALASLAALAFVATPLAPPMAAASRQDFALFGEADGHFPRDAVEFLLPREKPIRVFNSHEFGGYLVWRSMMETGGGPIGLQFIEESLDRISNSSSDEATTDTLSAAEGSPPPRRSVEEARQLLGRIFEPRPAPPDMESLPEAGVMLHTFIDGRTALFPPAANEDYIAITLGKIVGRPDRPEYIDFLLDYYEIDAVVLRNPDESGLNYRYEGAPRIPASGFFSRRLQREGGDWELKYEDGHALVFMRKSNLGNLRTTDSE